MIGDGHRARLVPASVGQAGMTLIEIMVAMAIVILLTSAVALSVRTVRRARLRKAAFQLAAAIRFAYDRANATGRDFRLVFDLEDDGSKYWLEVADKGHVRIGKTAERNEQIREAEDEERAAQKEAAEDGTTAGGLDEENVALKRAPKPAWHRFRSRLAKEVDLGKVRITGIYLARLEDTVTEGRAVLNFWGFGQTEPAVFWLEDDSDREYSVIVHPLTGKAKVVAGHYEVREEELSSDDEGEEVKER